MRKHSGIVIALVTIMTCQMFSLTACGSSLQSNEESLPDLQNEDNIIVSEFIEPSKELNDRMNDISFDFETKTVTLNSGYEMPILGLGTYSLLDDTAVESVAYALENGGRLVDTASFYRNEESVGDGIRQSGIPREEIFITTKLYPNQYGDAAAAIDEALEKLGVDYIDLMLLHHPGSNDVEAYHEMEKAVENGKIRSIGLSNWYIEDWKNFYHKLRLCLLWCKMRYTLTIRRKMW